MSGSLHDVKNGIWMRTVVISVGLLFFGALAYGVLAGGLGSMKHQEWDEANEEYEAAKNAADLALEEFIFAESRWENNGSQEEGALYEQYLESKTVSDEATQLANDAHHHEEQAHLSYLTWSTAGKTILVMFIVYAAFYGVAGFFNSIQPDEAHHYDDGHGDGHEEHHGSASPIMMAGGILFFMMGFPGFVTTCKAWLGLDYDADISGFTLSGFGAILLIMGIGNWWNEDLKGFPEQKATSHPFEGQDIRKAGMWIFLISETMVFATFFSSYLRMRTGWCTQWALDAGQCKEGAEITQTASDLLRHDVMTLLPGAINTFALIISSYTIVLALKTAKNVNWEPSKNALMAKLFPSRKKAVRNYLLITIALGSLFIVLKLVEWSHLIAEGFTIDTQAGSIFYVATGAHGLHVFIGLLVMLFMVFKADTVGYDEKNGQGIEYFGLYWHFVDLAWVAIFPAFYLY